MRLKVLLPAAVAIDVAAGKVSAEGLQGHFTLLPRHVDTMAVLVPGLLAWDEAGVEQFAAVDGGVLVKRGAEVIIGTSRAVRSGDLGALRRTLEEDFRALDERERAARNAISRLEVDFIQRFLEIEDRTHG